MKQSENSHKARPQRKAKRKILKAILVLAVVLILLAVFLPPALVSSEKGRKIILDRINTSLDGQVDFASLSMGWIKGLKVTDFSFSDAADRLSARAKHIIIKPCYGSILQGNFDAAIRLDLEQAECMGLDFGPAEADIRIRKGLLEIAPFSAPVNNGQFRFAGKVDFNHRPALLKTPAPMQIVKNIQINDKTTRKLLMYLNPVLADAVNVSGVADFNCEQLTIPLSEDEPNDIEVVGTISIDRLRMQASGLLETILSATGSSFREQNVTIHPTRFALRNGFLRYDDMQIDVGDKVVDFKGVIGLNKSLDMTVTVPYTTSGVGRRISLPLKGTIDRPELDLDLGKLLEEQLKQQLKQQLKEQLDLKSDKNLQEQLEDQLQEKLREGLEQLFK